MLDADSLTQIGTGAAQVAGIVIVVKYFIKFISLQEKNFTKIIGNHINHNTKALESNDKSNGTLARAVKELLVFLKEKNK